MSSRRQKEGQGEPMKTTMEGVAEAGHPATLKDVAAVAGVSIATVSKTLKGGYRLRPETEARVRAAATSLNFAPNQLAQSLHSKRTGTVGLLSAEMNGRFTMPVMMGAEDAFGMGDMSVFLSDARGDAVREQHHLQALLSHRIDGLIVMGRAPDPRPSLGRDLPVPVVYAYAPSDDPADVSVTSDNIGSGRIAAEHLIGNKRTRIAYVAGDANLIASTDRVTGAQAALAEHNLELVGGTAFYGNWSEEWGRNAVSFLLASQPDVDGILCGNDVIARGVLEGLHDGGRTVPREVSVVGHDNLELIATQTRPQLTTIDMNLEELGRTAAHLLLAAIDGKQQPAQHSVPTRIIQRGSSAPKY